MFENNASGLSGKWHRFSLTENNITGKINKRSDIVGVGMAAEDLPPDLGHSVGMAGLARRN